MRKTIHFLVLFVSICSAQLAYGGWNAAIRKNCAVLKRYRVEVHAGLAFLPLGSSVSVQRDGGCSYAHAGPLRRDLSGMRLAEAEAYVSGSSTWGWTYTNHFSNVFGIAGDPGQAQTGDARAPASADCPIPSARNHFFTPAVTFTDNGRAGKRITIEKVLASFAASDGYSVLEITAAAAGKTLWRGRAVVHEGRLTTDGELPSAVFTASTPTTRVSEVLYTIDSKDIVIPLPATVNLDDVEITLRGDAGNESVVKSPSFTTPDTIADLNMQAGNNNTPCPPLNVELSRDDAATVPYLGAVLANLDQRCATRGSGLRLDTITFTKCARDPRGGSFGPNATATMTCGK